MKRQNKTLNRFVAGGLILAILATIGIGAYLTDTDSKKDVYTVGNVQAEIIANGDMELDNVGALLPGTVHTYERAATNTGINDAYVFMSLTIPYEMVGVSEDDGTQIGERVRQLFTPGVDGGYIGSEWKLVDVGYIGQYEIEDNGQYCGEHDKYSAVVGDTITYVYGYIGDNADGSLKALKSGETTSNLVETMELTNLYHADKINGEISTKLYAIQSNNVNGGLTDVNGVWAVINKAISGEATEASTLTYSIVNTNTGDAIGYAPLKLVDENGNVVATSVANESGAGQFQNVPAGDYAIETAIGDLVLTGGSTGYGLRNKTAAVTITGEDASVALGLEVPVNTLVQGPVFNMHIPSNATSIEFVAMPQTYGLRDATVPEGAIDVSEAADGSVMAWMEDTTFYVVAMDGGMIYANPNSSYMFQNKSNLTYIGTDNLDTTTICNAVSLFRSCGQLTNDIRDFDFANARGLSNTFENCDWITEYTFPEGTIAVSQGMFYGCNNLTSVILPNGLKVIDGNAFDGCTNLSSINIPSTVEEIGWTAFRDCALVEVYIPASVKEIDISFLSPFCCNEHLTAINVDPDNKNYVSIDGVLFTKDMKTLITYPAAKSNTSYTIPEGVKNIHDQAFIYGENLVSLTFSNGVETIGDAAFSWCRKLANIEFVDTITTIGTDAFELTKWVADKAAAGEIVVVNGIWIDASAASGDFVIPDGTTEIPTSVFSNNSKITSVYIPASVKTIGDSAFFGCRNLTTVTFEEGSQLKSIGRSAFMNCYKLSNIELPNSVATISFMAFQNCTKLTNINIPTSLTSLAGSFGNTGLTSVTIPNNVTSVRSEFNNCFNLAEIIVADDHPTLKVIDGGLYNKDVITLLTYANGNPNTRVIIPEGVDNIYDYAFDGNTNIKEIVLPTSIKFLGAAVFRNCENLETIYFCGTQAQWNQISFGDGEWNRGVHADFKVIYDCVVDELPPAPAPAHKCESICPTCKLCLDKDCKEAACVNKCGGHVVTGMVGLMVQSDYNTWAETPAYYEFEIDGKVFRVDTGKITYAELPVGTYNAVVYAVFADGSRSTTVQNIDTVNVLTSTTNVYQLFLGEIPTHTLTLGVNDAMNWGDKTVQNYIFSIDNGAYSLIVEPNKTCSISLPAGQHTVTGTVVFTDGTNSSLSGKISLTGFSLTQNRTYTVSIGYKTTISITDNINWGDLSVNYYTVKVGNIQGNVQSGYNGNIYVSAGTHNITVTARLKNGTVVDITEYVDIKTVEINSNTTLKLTLSGTYEYVAPAHTCESICPTCKLCLDVKCAEVACAKKCAGHAATTCNVAFRITDNNAWAETPVSYIINLGDKEYSAEVYPGKIATFNLPIGNTYNITVWATFANGTSKAIQQQSMTSITVKAGLATQTIILGEVKNYNLSIGVNDVMNWGDKVVDHYQVNIADGKYSVDVLAGQRETVSVIEGTNTLEVIVHFTDGSSTSMRNKGTQSASSTNVTKDTNYTITLGYRATVSITDNLDLGQSVTNYTVRIGSRGGSVSAGKSGTIYVGTGTYDITVSVKLADGSTVDVTEYLDIKTVEINGNTTLKLTLNEEIETPEVEVPELSEGQVAVVIIDKTSNTNTEKPSTYYIFVGGKAHQAQLAYGDEYAIIDDVADGTYSVSVSVEYPTLGVQAPKQNIEEVIVDADNKVITIVLSDNN